MIETFDDCLLELGNPGKFRLFLFFLLSVNMCMVAFNFFISILSGFVPKHHCKLPIDSNFTLNESIPLIEVKNHLELDSCSMWLDPTNTSKGTTACLHGWEYEMQDGENFVSTQFDLVCDRRYVLNMGISFQYFGIMLGGIAFGILSDKMGRRKSVIIAMVGHSFFAIALAFTHTASIYFTCAFLLGFFIQGLHSCSYTLSCELFHPSQRTIQGILIGFPWSLAVLLMAGSFWALGNWNHVQLVPGVLSLIGIGYIWYIPESLRWHMARGHVDQVWQITERFARFNKLYIRPSLREEFVKLSAKMIDSQAIHGKEGTLKDLFRSPRIRKYSLIMGLTYFSGCATYFGIGLAIPKLGGNKYVSFLISGSLELLARIIPIYIYQNFGRRRPFSFFITVASGLCLLSAVIKYFTDDGDGTINSAAIAIAILANVTLTMGFAGIGLYITELFPTLLRSAGLGFCVTCGRIGSIISPQIMLLEFVWELLPFLTFCIIGVMCGILILMLPETNNKPLPDSVADVGNLDKKSVKSKK